jgi:hypothetical protein
MYPILIIRDFQFDSDAIKIIPVLEIKLQLIPITGSQSVAVT